MSIKGYRFNETSLLPGTDSQIFSYFVCRFPVDEDKKMKFHDKRKRKVESRINSYMKTPVCRENTCV